MPGGNSIVNKLLTLGDNSVSKQVQIEPKDPS